MAKDIFFIPIIAKALEADDPEKALQDAFDEIKLLSRQAGYEQMYMQFQKFMDTIFRHVKPKTKSGTDFSDTVVKELILELATGTFDGDSHERDAALKLIHSNEKWEEMYKEISSQLEEETEEPCFEILIERDAMPVNTISLKGKGGHQVLKDIIPGHYILKFDTGRIIWDGQLSEEDLIWTKAYPRQPLKLAADTEGKDTIPKREISLLDDKIVLRVFPGLESGTIGIKVKK